MDAPNFEMNPPTPQLKNNPPPCEKLSHLPRNDSEKKKKNNQKLPSRFWRGSLQTSGNQFFNACGANLLQLTVNVINSGKNCSILIERVN